MRMISLHNGGASVCARDTAGYKPVPLAVFVSDIRRVITAVDVNKIKTKCHYLILSQISVTFIYPNPKKCTIWI
jgi:hypothetical protein